jgi:hypothetical protein
MALPQEAWRTVSWREGSNAELSSRFAMVRVRPPHRPTPRSNNWSSSPRCVGESSATIRNSSKSSASRITRDEVGRDFITTPLCASPLMASLSPSASAKEAQKKRRSTKSAFLSRRLRPSRQPHGCSGMCLTRFRRCDCLSHARSPTRFSDVRAVGR